jgi:Formate hydrogenlyase subunit 3/Multisubunit Na+/H+ antiporter, MnhD subunit
MSLGSYLLVAFNYREWEAVEASLKYLIMSSTGSAALLFGISLLYGLSGDLTFAGMRSVLASEVASKETWSVAAFAFVIGGLAVNAAVAPFHFWLPDAHPAAPSPVSALLSGVVIKTGVYGMLRLLLNVFPLEQYGWQLGLLMLGVVTMTVGNLMAALQDDIKRLLAFSSVANIGYIVFGISLGNQLGLVGSVLHVLNHAVAKALLFLSAGSFIHTFHTRSLEELSGAGKHLPVTGITYTVGALSLAGVPGLNAFVSEYIVIAGALASPFWPFAVVMVLNVLIGAMYHLRVIQTIFLKPPQRANPEAAKEPGFSMLLPMVLLAVAAIVIGIYPSPFLAAAEAALRSIPLVR